jgi:hypothetical protein
MKAIPSFGLDEKRAEAFFWQEKKDSQQLIHAKDQKK